MTHDPYAQARELEQDLISTYARVLRFAGIDLDALASKNALTSIAEHRKAVAHLVSVGMDPEAADLVVVAIDRRVAAR